MHTAAYGLPWTAPLVSDNHIAENPSVSTDDMTLLREAAASHKSGDKEKARELLQQAAEFNPANELVLLWQASLARTADEAMSAIEKVLSLNPNNEKAIGWKVKLESRFPAAEPVSAESNTTTATVEDEVEQKSEAVVELVEEESADVDTAEEATVDVEEAETEAEAAVEPVDEESTYADTVAQLEQAVGEKAELVEEETAAVGEDEEEEASSDLNSWISEESTAEAVEETLTDTEETSDEVELLAIEDESTEDAELAALEAEVASAEEAHEQDSTSTEEEEVSTEELLDSAYAETDSVEDFWEQAESEESDTSEELVALGVEEESYDSTARALEALDQHVSDPKEQEEEDDDPIRRLLAEKDDGVEDRYETESDEIETESAYEEETDASILMAMLTEDEPGGKSTESEELVEATATDEEQVAPVVETIVNTHWECPLCGQQSHRVEPWCPSCKAIVDLDRVPDMAQNDDVDRVSLKRLVADWEDQVEIEPDPAVFTKLAIAYLNLRQSNSALPHLLAAARMDRGNDALASALEEVSRRPLILVVDDSRTVQRMVLSTLEKELFRVQIAEDGLQALAKLNDETPSLILLDITMPRMDGYQVCKVITGNDAFKHIPVVMLSGKDGFFDKMKGRMVGAKDYITKPFEGDSLVKTVRKRIDVPTR